MSGKPARLGVELVLGCVLLAMVALVLAALLFEVDPEPPEAGQLVIMGLSLTFVFLLGKALHAHEASSALGR